MKVILFFVFMIPLASAIHLEAQPRIRHTANANKIKSALKIDTGTKSFLLESLLCDKNYKCGLFPNENEKTSTFGDDKTTIWIGRNGKDFLVSIDNNGVKGRSDEKKIPLANSSTIAVNIRKRINNKAYTQLPFDISHKTNEENGRPYDSFLIQAHYVAKGTIHGNNCSAKIQLTDLNMDGRFDQLDAQRGTNLGIDLNNDGKFWGKSEFHHTNEIIEFCGKRFLVSRLSNAEIELTSTNLTIAKVGESVPFFSMRLLDGPPITSDSLRGHAFVLDFWASWCKPCIANLPLIQKLRDELGNAVSVYSVNVDSPSKTASAKSIIEQGRMQKFSVIRGLGENDPLWKTFGGANLNRLAIPLYVLVDRDGIVRYANSGGDNLADLRNAINKTVAR